MTSPQTFFVTVVLATAFVSSTVTVTGATPIRFEEHLIQGNYTYAYGIAVADLDGDGDPDVTSSDAFGHDSLYWFENDGKGRFKRHFVQKDDPERLERHKIGDVDADGHPDIVMVKNRDGDILWFRNSGTPADGRLWQRLIITKGGLPNAYDVSLADLDGDGDLDVAASSWTGNRFAWFENDGTPADAPWKRHLIEENVAQTRAIMAADIDGDGDLDLVGSARLAPLVVWYENSGQPTKRPWKRHVINDKFTWPVHGQVVDMDQDGDLDVLMAHGMAKPRDQAKTRHVVWYENDGTPAQGDWTMHVVGDSLTSAFEARAGDLDGDGDLDIVATAWEKPGQVVWYENQGNPKGRWTKHMIKDNWERANQVVLADLDGDGKLDVVACAEHGSYELRWWRNAGATSSGTEEAAGVRPKLE